MDARSSGEQTTIDELTALLVDLGNLALRLKTQLQVREADRVMVQY